MLLMAATHSNASADTLVFSQGFETDKDGIFDVTNGGSGGVKRVASVVLEYLLRREFPWFSRCRRRGPPHETTVTVQSGQAGFDPQWMSTALTGQAIRDCVYRCDWHRR
jgi:hypothetical protein